MEPPRGTDLGVAPEGQYQGSRETASWKMQVASCKLGNASCKFLINC